MITAIQADNQLFPNNRNSNGSALNAAKSYADHRLSFLRSRIRSLWIKDPDSAELIALIEQYLMAGGNVTSLPTSMLSIKFNQLRSVLVETGTNQENKNTNSKDEATQQTDIKGKPGPNILPLFDNYGMETTHSYRQLYTYSQVTQNTPSTTMETWG